jgi:uncharacterized protein YndB with AHSA1/START domain
MSNEHEIERTTELPAAPEEVWEALTDEDGLAGWFGSEDEVAARKAARIDEADPGRRLAWTWWPEGESGGASTVEITLVPTTGGTRLTVIERPPLTATATASASARVDGWLMGIELLFVLRSIALVAAQTT